VKNANRQALRASATSVIERVRGFTWFYVEKRAGVEGWEKRGRAIFTRHRDGNWVVPLERSSHHSLRRHEGDSRWHTCTRTRCRWKCQCESQVQS